MINRAGEWKLNPQSDMEYEREDFVEPNGEILATIETFQTTFEGESFERVYVNAFDPLQDCIVRSGCLDENVDAKNWAEKTMMLIPRGPDYWEAPPR